MLFGNHLATLLLCVKFWKMKSRPRIVEIIVRGLHKRAIIRTEKSSRRVQGTMDWFVVTVYCTPMR